MNDILTPNTIEYPGDEAFAEFLVRNKCPLPFHTVRFRFWGQMVSVALRVSPMEEIQDIWDNEPPVFENEEEAQSFFDVTFSLWNALSEMNMAGRRLQLSQRRGLDNPAGLRTMIEIRLDELDKGFLSGFIGDMTVYDEEDPKTAARLTKLVNMIDMLEEQHGRISSDQNTYGLVRKEFLALDKSAQRNLDNLVKAANAQRKIGQQSGTVH